MEKLKVLIGRSSQCDYTIENPDQHGTVSGSHATISDTETPNVYLFEDHSTNGSYINGQYLHNGSCNVKTTDHITLGKTYTLPIADIVNRFLSTSKTTKKKPQPQPEKQVFNPMASADPIPSGEPTMPQENVVTIEKVVEKEVVKEVEKVPTWYWGLFIAAIVVAFILGFCVNC